MSLLTKDEKTLKDEKEKEKALEGKAGKEGEEEAPETAYEIIRKAHLDEELKRVLNDLTAVLTGQVSAPSTGPAGATGAVGATGATGVMGPMGPTGATGSVV